jgi:hypothetical protein
LSLINLDKTQKYGPTPIVRSRVLNKFKMSDCLEKNVPLFKTRSSLGYKMRPSKLQRAAQKAFMKQVGETAAFLASENGVLFNSHIVDVDCGKLNVL